MVGAPLRTSGQNRRAELADATARPRDFVYISRGNADAHTREETTPLATVGHFSRIKLFRSALALMGTITNQQASLAAISYPLAEGVLILLRLIWFL